MRKALRSFIPICGTTFLLFVVSLYPTFHFGGWVWVKGVMFGYLLSLLNILFSLLSIQRAFQKSIKTFYAIVLGGMMLRLFVFAAMIYLIWHFKLANVMAFIISFMIFYLFLQIFEIRSINKELKSKVS